MTGWIARCFDHFYEAGRGTPPPHSAGQGGEPPLPHGAGRASLPDTLVVLLLPGDILLLEAALHDQAGFKSCLKLHCKEKHTMTKKKAWARD